MTKIFLCNLVFVFTIINSNLLSFSNKSFQEKETTQTNDRSNAIDYTLLLHPFDKNAHRFPEQSRPTRTKLQRIMGQWIKDYNVFAASEHYDQQHLQNEIAALKLKFEEKEYQEKLGGLTRGTISLITAGMAYHTIKLCSALLKESNVSLIPAVFLLAGVTCTSLYCFFVAINNYRCYKIWDEGRKTLENS